MWGCNTPIDVGFDTQAEMFALHLSSVDKDCGGGAGDNLTAAAPAMKLHAPHQEGGDVRRDGLCPGRRPLNDALSDGNM